jgi:cellulose synthase/poly-beta-1,6-N-acetylglucosamine synthase-like glycosyltransferase
MLRDAVIYNALFLVVTSGLLFLSGHRLRLCHWAASQLTLGSAAIAAWLLLCVAAGPTPLPLGALAAVLIVGSVITATWQDWNPAGHASFTAIVLTVATFLAYAAFVLVTAHLGPLSFLFGTLFLILQAAALVLLVVYTFEILDVVCRTRWHRQFGPKIVAGYGPKVSLHVPTHNEPPELVIQTLNALARLDYRDFEVLVIDNNTADESLWRPVEAHCARLGSRFRFFHLMPWPGFKSGALNYALDQTAADAEIIGIVDADYVVEPRYLHDLVGHFSDPAIAFVQTPQDYRDQEAQGRYGRALYLSYLYFFCFSMPCRNERNGIIFAGTMGLIRRDALETVGRWDEWCITEDAEVSVRLLKAGYQSVYVGQSYGHGLMPLDYAGLKKQRFRWAFGGMQLLRMHGRALIDGRAAGSLTRAQRFAYLSGGLQWLSDPMSIAFATSVLIASGALIVGGSVFIQPLAAGTILVPPLLVAFGVARFLWAFRVRVRCTWREAWDAFTVLLGLTWVVSLACFHGLTRRQGVFLRTPKQSERLRPIDSVRVVWMETSFAAICLLALVGVAISHPVQPLSARSALLGLLAWQMVLFASAVRSSIWNYRSCRAASLSPSAQLTFRAVADRLGLFEGEWKLARAHGVAAGGAVALFYVAVLFAPTVEQIWRSDPLGRLIPARTLLPPRSTEAAAAALIREADAVQRQDLQAALALWDPKGVIKDDRFTPDIPDDDRVWRGMDGIRQRYTEEFQQRHYRKLSHQDLVITLVTPDKAIIVNDLDAVIDADDRSDHVRLDKTDRWTLIRDGGQWRIVMLESNRARIAPVVRDAHLQAVPRPK